MPDPVINPAAKRLIPVARPTVGWMERQYVEEALDSGWLSGNTFVRNFEREFAFSHGMPEGVACNSGTSALMLALRAAGVQAHSHPEEFEFSGSLVICPAMTMVAVPNAVLACGGEPMFVDSDPRTGNVDLQQVEDLANRKRKRLKAVVIVHLYGVPCELPQHSSGKYLDIPGVASIEDCCEAHYAKFLSGQPVGSRSDYACFSFFANKPVACGEGGMVLCDMTPAERLRGLRAHAFTDGEHFTHKEFAWGVRMGELAGAVGLAQHRQREEFLRRRKEIAEHYLSRLTQISWIQFQQRTPGSAWWVMPILCYPGCGRTRDQVRQKLADAGIETRTWFKPMHTQAHLSRFVPAGQTFPVADDLYARGLYLPLYPSMEDEDVDYICDVLRGL